MPLTERDLETLDPLRLDREIARAVQSARSGFRALPDSGEAALDPFFATRLISSRTAFRIIADMPAADPLREPLLRHVYRLADARIQWRALLAAANERHAVLRGVSEPEHGRLSLARVLEAALQEPGRRASWLASFVRAAPPLGDAEALYWERRSETALRLGESGPDAMELPHPKSAELASAWLDRTSDMFAEQGRSSLAELLDVALASATPEGWPRRLVPATLVDWFRGTDLLRSLDLDPGELPKAIAPSSFIRGLRRLGAAWVDATAPHDQPFVVANDPFGLARRTAGALFGFFPAMPAFAKRILGIDASQLRDRGRVLAAALLVDSRASALRVVLRAPALEGRRALREAFEGETHRALSVPLPPPAAGAIFRLRPDDPQRFLGLLLAAGRASSLEERHDDDWYRNPRAIEQLRDEARLSPEPRTNDESVARGADALFATLAAALG